MKVNHRAIHKLCPVSRQVVVCVSLAKEVSGGPRVEADCDSINNASSFGVRWQLSISALEYFFKVLYTIIVLLDRL